VTLQNIKVVDIKEDQNLLLLQGGIPEVQTVGFSSRVRPKRKLLLPGGLRKGMGWTTFAVYDIGNQKVSGHRIGWPDL